MKEFGSVQGNTYISLEQRKKALLIASQDKCKEHCHRLSFPCFDNIQTKVKPCRKKGSSIITLTAKSSDGSTRSTLPMLRTMSRSPDSIVCSIPLMSIVQRPAVQKACARRLELLPSASPSIEWEKNIRLFSMLQIVYWKNALSSEILYILLLKQILELISLLLSSYRSHSVDQV